MKQCSQSILLFVWFELDALRLCRFALHETLALVTFAADTVDRVNTFALDLISLRKVSSEKMRKLTKRYSLVASCHSFVIVRGGGLANEWMKKKIAAEAPTPIAV